MDPRSPITPWPAPKDAPALLFGGSFDPPHRAHAELAVAARDRAMPDAWLVVIPASRSPHKSVGPAASDEDRVRMLEIAFANTTSVSIWTDEIDRASAGMPSFWSNTLDRVLAARPDGLEGVRFLIGADQALAFHRWHDAVKVLQRCQPVVIPRGEITSVGQLSDALERTRAWSDRDLAVWRRSFIDVSPMRVSSTKVRAGTTDDVDPRVLEYIDERGLYR
ncbi:MAG: nicotinate-nicotinamide nucleotide adenylyltransferase [Planctomycetota bacterium]